MFRNLYRLQIEERYTTTSTAGVRRHGDARPRRLATKGEAHPGARRTKPRSDMKPVRLKRAYDAPSSDDGLRVLVDRLWPRGLSADLSPN